MIWTLLSVRNLLFAQFAEEVTFPHCLTGNHHGEKDDAIPQNIPKILLWLERWGSAVGWIGRSPAGYLKTHYRRFGPKYCRKSETLQEAYDLQAVMYNQKLSLTLFKALLLEGEGCLSVDQTFQAMLSVMPRVTVDYFDRMAKTPNQAQRFNSIVVNMKLII